MRIGKGDKTLRLVKLINDELAKLGSIAEITEFITLNWPAFCQNAADSRKHKVTPLVALDIQLEHWSMSIANTHSCPRGGVTNFTQREYRGDLNPVSLPRGYPGWSGSIVYEFVGDPIGFMSDYFDDTVLCLGGGGGHTNLLKGTKECRYDLKLWAADFPKMWDTQQRNHWVITENLQREQVWKALGGHGLVPRVTHDDIPKDWAPAPADLAAM